MHMFDYLTRSSILSRNGMVYGIGRVSVVPLCTTQLSLNEKKEREKC